MGPPPVANHGSGNHALNPQEQSEIRQLHRNLGHPDARKFMTYLKQEGAAPEIIKAAGDYKCDACVEAQKGYAAARPSSIHEHISFNTKVRMDLASWRNAKGTEFHFTHFIDEAPMFHLGAECSQGAEGVLGMFEQLCRSGGRIYLRRPSLQECRSREQLYTCLLAMHTGSLIGRQRFMAVQSSKLMSREVFRLL